VRELSPVACTRVGLQGATEKIPLQTNLQLSQVKMENSQFSLALFHRVLLEFSKMWSDCGKIYGALQVT